MAKKDLNFIIDSSDDAALQSLAKIVQKQESVISKLKETNRASKDTKKEFEEMGSPLGRVVADVGKIAAGFLTAQGAAALLRKGIEMVKAEVEDLKRKQEDAARAQLTFQGNFSQVIGQSFGLPGIQQLDAYSRQVKADASKLNVSPNLLVQMIDSYKAARPGATWEQTRAVYTKGVGAVGFENPVEMTRLVGELQEIMPGKDIGDLYDIAAAQRSAAGKRIEQLSESTRATRQLVALGIDPEKALGLTQEAFQQELEARSLSTLVEMVGRDIQTVKRPKTEKDKIGNILAAMTPDQRLEWIFANQQQATTYYGGQVTRLAPILSPETLARGKQQIVEAQQQDVYQKTIQAYEGTQTSKLIKADVAAEGVVEQLKLSDPEAAAKGMVNDRLRQILEQTTISKAERDYIQARIDYIDTLGGGQMDIQIQELQKLEKRFGSPYAYKSGPGIRPYSDIDYGLSTGRFADPTGYVPYRDNPAYDPQLATAIHGLLDEVKKLRDATEKNTNEIQRQNSQASSLPAVIIEE